MVNVAVSFKVNSTIKTQFKEKAIKIDTDKMRTTNYVLGSNHSVGVIKSV